MAESNFIEVRLTGEDITPGNVKSKDIADLISSIEEMLASLAVRENPNMGLDEDEIIVGLVAVQEGSLTLQFRSPDVYEKVVIPAYKTITDSISQHFFDNLPSKTVESLRKIRKITVGFRASTEFWISNGHYEHLATLARETTIETQNRLVSSTTTLYGSIVRVGGEKVLTAQIRLISGELIKCEIKGLQKLNVAKELARRLFTEVGVTGKATWDSLDWKLEEFEIESITDYSGTKIRTALQGLYETAGKYLESIEDIDAFIAEVRGEAGDDE